MASILELAEMACDTMESTESRADFFSRIVNEIKSMEAAEAGQHAATLLHAFEECAKSSETPEVHAAALRMLNAMLDFPSLRDENTKKRILPTLVRCIRAADVAVLTGALSALNVFEPELLQDPAVCAAIAKVLKADGEDAQQSGAEVASALLVSIVTDAALPFRQMASSLCLPSLLLAVQRHGDSEALHDAASEAVGRLLDATLSALATNAKASLLEAADAAVLLCVACLRSPHGTAIETVWTDAAQALPTLLSVNEQQVRTFHSHGGLQLAARLPVLGGRAREDTADALLLALTGEQEAAAAAHCDMPGISSMIDSITQVLGDASCSAGMEDRASRLLTAASSLLPLVQQREEEEHQQAQQQAMREQEATAGGDGAGSSAGEAGTPSAAAAAGGGDSSADAQASEAATDTTPAAVRTEQQPPAAEQPAPSPPDDEKADGEPQRGERAAADGEPQRGDGAAAQDTKAQAGGGALHEEKGASDQPQHTSDSDTSSAGGSAAPANNTTAADNERARARADSQASISTAQADVAAAAAAVTALRQQEQELLRKADALRSSQRKLHASVAASEEEAAEKQVQLQRLETKLNKLQGDTKAARELVSQEKEALSALQADAAAARAAADEAEAAVLAAKTDESEALQVAKMGLADDAKQLQEVQAQRAAAQQRIDDTRKQCDMLAETLRGQVADSKAAVAALQLQRADMDKEKGTVQQDIAQLERQLQTLREQRTPLQSQVAEAGAAAAHRQREADASAARAATKAAAKAEAEASAARHAELMAKTELQEARAAAQAAEAQLAELKAQHAQAAHNTAAADAKLQDELQATAAERDQLRAQVSELGEALNAQTGSHSALGSQVQEAQEDAERLRAAAARSAEEANTARAAASAAEEALQAASLSHKQALGALQGEVTALKAQLVAQRASATATAQDEPASEQVPDSESVAQLQQEALASEAAAARAELVAARSQLQDCREQLQATQAREVTLQGALDAARGEQGAAATASPGRDMATTGQLRSRVSALQRAVASFKREVQGMQEQLEAARSSGAAHKKRSERFAEAIRAARAEVSALQSAAASKDAQLAAARARAAALEDTVAETDSLAAEAASRLRSTVEQRDMAVSSAERRWFARVREAEVQRMAAEATSQALQSRVREHAPHLLSDLPQADSADVDFGDAVPSVETGTSLLQLTQRAQEAEATAARLTAEREEMATQAMQHVQLAKHFAYAGIQAVQALAQAHARALLLAVEHNRTAAVAKVEAEVASRAAATAAASAEKVAAALLAEEGEGGGDALLVAREELQRLADSSAAAGEHDPQVLLTAASSMVPEWLTPALRSVLEGSAMQDARPEVQAFFAALSSTVRAFVGRRCEDIVGSSVRSRGDTDGRGASFEHMFSLVDQVLSRAGLDEAIGAAAARTAGTAPAASTANALAASFNTDQAPGVEPAARAVSAPVVEQLTRAAMSALVHAAFAHLRRVAQRKRLLGPGGTADGVPVSVFREWMRSRGLCATSAVRAQRKGRLGSFVTACLSYADVDVLLAGAMAGKGSSGKALLSFVEFTGVLQAIAQRTYDEHFAAAAEARNMWLGGCFFDCREQLAWQTISHFAFVAWQLGPALQPTLARVPGHAEDSWLQCLDKAWRDSSQLQLGDAIAQAKFKLSATRHALELSQQPFAQLFACVPAAAALSAAPRASSPAARASGPSRSPRRRGPQRTVSTPDAKTREAVHHESAPPSPNAPPPVPAAAPDSGVPPSPGAAEESKAEQRTHEAPGFTAAMVLMKKNTQQLKSVFRFYLNTAQRLGMSATPPRQLGAAQPVTTVPLALVLQCVKEFGVVPDLVAVPVAATHIAEGLLGGTVPEARAVETVLKSRNTARKHPVPEQLRGVEVHFADFVHMLGELACFAGEDAAETDVWDVTAASATQRAQTLLSWMELSSGKQAMHKARGVSCAPFVVS